MLKALRTIWLLLALSVPSWTPAAAQEITQADRTAIAARIDAFNAVMKAGRVGEVVDFIPPRLVASIAKASDVSESVLREELAAQGAEVFKVVKLISFGMDMTAATAGMTPDHSRAYLLIPTETLIEWPDGRRIRNRNSTLSLKEDGRWYLVRIEQPQQILMLRETYPEFEGVEFPTGGTNAAD